MKTLTKTLLGLTLFLIFASLSFGLLNSKKASAEKITNPQPVSFYLDACAGIAGPAPGAENVCKFMSDTVLPPSSDIQYGNGALEVSGWNNDIFFSMPFREGGYSLNSPPITITTLSSSTSKLYFNSDPKLNNFGGSAALLTSKTNGINYYVYSSDGDSDYKLLVGFRTDGSQVTPIVLALASTKIQEGNTSLGTVYAYEGYKDIVMATPTGAPGTPPGSAGTSLDATCEQISFTSLEWLICPVFKIADGTATFLIDLFEKLLSFRINDEYDRSVKPAWSAIKNIVSALVVIVMLVMIFAQAFSIGPFDAYTIRKLLPRIVVAVILIQLSWYLFAWIINVVDDIGVGLKDLFNNIFSSATGTSGVKVNINNFWELLANAGIGSGGIGFFSIVTAVAAVVAVTVALPLVLLGLFAALVAIAVGLAVLIFRLVLILVLLLSSPVALLAWVLPGTEKYWKMWWDNFLKVLFMFPIIILIIEAGRIFAFVGGPIAPANILAFLFILVGFFGPLFILPKTFRWGGALMQAAGQGAFKASGVLSQGPKKYFQARQEGYRAERIRQSQERYKRGQGVSLNRDFRRGFGLASLYRRPIDLARSGQVDPLLWGRRREQAMTSYIAKGAESEEADIKAADAKYQQIFAEAENHDLLARQVAAGQENITYTTKTGQTRRLGRISMAERQAGLNAVLKYGGNSNMRFLDRTIDQLNNGTDAERVMVEKFRDANSAKLLPAMKHVYFGANRDEAIAGMVAGGGLSESAFTSMDGAEMEAILESLSNQAAQGSEEAAQHLSTVLSFYESAINNPNIRPIIGTGVHRAVEAFVNGANLDDINLGSINPQTGRREGGRVGVGGADLAEIVRDGVVTHPSLEGQVARLSGRISPSGNVQPPSAA